MKKIVLVISMSIFALPVNAVCLITGGACAAPVNFEPQSLEQKFVPNHLQQMQRTDAFQNDIQKPFDNRIINSTSRSETENSDYNSNCQFGVCLPGSNKFENAE